MNTRVGRWAPMLALPAMVLALAGCSSDGDEGEKASGDTSSDASSPTGTPSADPTSLPDLPTPPTVRQFEGGAAADVDWDPTTCKTAPGEQTVTGRLTNPTNKKTDYLVTLSWTNATSDVLGLGYRVVRGVKPDQERTWKLTADVAEGAVQCVINVQRGSIKK